MYPSHPTKENPPCLISAGTMFVSWIKINLPSLISGFRCEVDRNRALLGCYAESRDNFLATFRDNLSVPCIRVENPGLLFFINGTESFPRNVGNKLSLLAA